jgi:TPR repeat protein
MKKILAGPLVLLLLVTNSWAEFDEGVVAYAMGQYDKALKTLVPLAESANHPYAQYYLGVMYAEWPGDQTRPCRSGKMVWQAAKQGVPQAQFRLGELPANAFYL